MIDATTLAGLLPDYRAHLVGRGQRPRGVDAYAREAAHFVQWLHTNGAMLNEQSISRYRDMRATTHTTSTVHKDMCVVRSVCHFLIRRALIDKDPTQNIDFPKAKKSIPRALKRPQIKQMLEAIEIPRRKWEKAHTWERARLGIILFLYTGLRLSEVAALLWEDIDLDAATIVVQEGKGGKPRCVPIHPRLARELVNVSDRSATRAVIGDKDGNTMHPKSVAEIFTRWLTARGVDITPHQLRHTFATELLRAGAPLPDIQAALGHASLETTQVYLLVDADHLRKSIDLLPAGW